MWTFCFQVINPNFLENCLLPKILTSKPGFLKNIKNGHQLVKPSNNPQSSTDPTPCFSICTRSLALLCLFPAGSTSKWTQAKKVSYRMFSDVNIDLDTKSEQKFFLLFKFSLFQPLFIQMRVDCGTRSCVNYASHSSMFALTRSSGFGSRGRSS